MKKLLLFMDNQIYGGSEKLMYSIINNHTINEEYNIKVMYGKNKYMANGIKNDYGNMQKNFYAPHIITNSFYYHMSISNTNIYIKNIIRLPFWLLNQLFITAFYNFVILFIYTIFIKPDCIHINNGGHPGSLNCRIMIFIASLLNIKFIYQVNNQACKVNGFKDKIIDNILNNKVQQIIVASKLAKEKLIHNRSLKSEKISIIPNTIREEIISKSRNELLCEFNIPNSKYIITEVAFLEERKGQKYLIKAIKQIRDEYPDIFKKLHLILVGSGVDEHALHKLIKKYELCNNVTLTGYRTDSINFINASDLFILPSIGNEDMPLVILSAMKLGKNIISTNFAGIKEEIINDVSGKLIEPDINTLSDNIQKNIVDCISSHKNWGKEACKRFYSFFSPEIYTQSILNLYKRSF